MRVLIVEDDASLGQFLQKRLLLEGHEVAWVEDGEAALDDAEKRPPDLMVLDLGLPRRDGTEVLGLMRTDFPQTAVLVLSGRSDLEERVRCLDMGADDFMLKPFSFHELLARCRALLRRRDRFSDPVLRFGGVELDRMARTVLYENQPVRLTVREFKLMESLILRKGECCTRAELLSHVWSGTPAAGTNIVDVYITYLRKKLAAAHPEGEAGLSVIETVRGSGYRLRDKRRIPRLEDPAKTVMEREDLVWGQMARPA
jgi:DNA-binding response OmpR family regulator